MALQIAWFKATDFRSLADVTLGQPEHPLPPVVLLYGENSVGKSNLLRAVGAWLRLIQHAIERSEGRALRTGEIWQIEDELAGSLLGRPAQWQFRRNRTEITLLGCLRRKSVQNVPVAPDDLLFGFRLTLLPNRQVRITTTAVPALDPQTLDDELFSWMGYFRHEPWMSISAQRRFHDEALSDQPLIGGPRPDASDLKQRLFLANNGTDSVLIRAFKERFIAALTSGPFHMDEPRTVIDAEQAIDLHSEGRPLTEQGSGPQQWALIAGMLAVSRAGLVGIEEPEINLSWESQERVAAWLGREVASSGHPPWQIFATSHSRLMYGLTGTAGIWFRVWADKGVTQVEQHEGAAALDRVLPPPPPGAVPARAMKLYTGNVVALRDELIAHLELEIGEHLYGSRENDGTVRLIGEKGFERIENEGSEDE